ncbi:hypothetical protein ACEWY4_000777 [Coilia grayii]|uniref:SEFIR domain-containing protein n=1 Tax=Coilia grayii TaxID=363190 RepID=A0ABD1KXM7_9TELE
MTEGSPMVKVRLCYRWSPRRCVSFSPPAEFQTNATNSFPTNISFPYILPCVCIQMYSLSYHDAKRRTICPFENMTEDGVLDVWSASKITYNNSTLTWHSLCPSTSLFPSASLCWNNRDSLADCLVLPNTTLEVVDRSYDVSDVDRHPQMCIKFSLNNSHHVHCPFGHVYQWDVTNLAIIAGHLRISIISKTTASYAGQLCTPVAEECAVVGREHYVSTEWDSTTADLVLPLPFPFVGLCVQVWRFEPVLRGRRIFCLDDPQVHRRGGLIVGATLAFVLTLILLGSFAYHQLSKQLSGFCVNRPVLLVSSSDEASHVSAVLALASGLKAELQCSVRLALWDHCASQDSIAHLGPVPWLHAQCQAVLQAGGIVLITWSTSASDTYKRKQESGRAEDRGGEESRRAYPQCKHLQLASSENRKNGTCDCNPKDWTYEIKAEKDMNGATQNTECGERALQGCRSERDEKTSVTALVLDAALSCVQAALQSNLKSTNFIVLYFQRKGSDESKTNRTLPAVLQTLPIYNLPQNLPEVVLELSLGPSRRNVKSEGRESAYKKPGCWLWLPGLCWAQHVSWRCSAELSYFGETSYRRKK